MWLARKKPKKKPRKKRRNAKARYDKEYPVVPIRLPKIFKKQLAKEAEKKDLMISQYMRDLLQGFEIRERVIEKIVEKPVIKIVEKTVEDPEKEEEIKELKEAIKTVKETVSLQNNELAEASILISARDNEMATLEKSCNSLSKNNDDLLTRLEIEEQELQNKVEEVDWLKKSMSLVTDDYNAFLEKHRSLERQNTELNEGLSRSQNQNARFKKQLEWALNELKCIDERNRKIAHRISLTHGIELRYVRTTWKNMPE